MKKRILLIDDDRLVLTSIEKLILSKGYEVRSYQSPVEALKAFSDHEFDLVISDIRMSGQDGIETAQGMRQIEEEQGRPQTPIIMMTGYASEDTPVQAIKIGVQDYFLKPLDNDELLKSIEFHLEKRYKKLRKAYDRESINTKVNYFSELIGKPLKHIKGCTYDTNYFKGNIENPIGIAQVPLGIAGPISVNGKNAQGNFYVPMATTEGVLVLTYDFGMRLLQLSGPVETEVVSNVVHLDPMFPIRKNEDVCIIKFVDENFHEIKKIAESGSRHLTLLKIEDHRIGNNLVLNFFYDTCDAHGLNMINHATFNACKFIEAKTGAFFYHRSHYSGVKHHSPLNEKMGYGRVVKASALLSSKTLRMLGTTAKELKEFFDRCTEVAHATGILSVNVHAANAIAAIFIACGQDVADVSSSAVCSTTVELTNGGECLRITCTLRNLLVGTVGGGTGLGTQSECLNIMGCLGSGKSDKFAEIIAATVLAGEFPTAAAVINRTYIAMHEQYGRNKDKLVND